MPVTANRMVTTFLVEFFWLLLVMESVANHLQNEATSRSLARDKDAFGRSSFNRYYYAAFIEARNMMAGLRVEWARLPHKQIPTVLRDSIGQDFKAASRKALRVQDNATVHACSTAITAAKGLADLLESSFATRVVADYRLDTMVLFDKAPDFTLNSVPISVARHWPSKAKGFALSITNGWRQAGVISR